MRSYRLYYKQNGKKVYFDAFDAESNEIAAQKVDEKLNDIDFVKEHGKKIYWDFGDGISSCDEKGNVIKTWNSAQDMFDEWREEENTWKWYKKIYYWFIRKWNHYDPWFNIKLGFERMFTGYDRRVTWNIDLSIRELLRHAVPKYIKNMHGCPNDYCERARKLLSGMTDEEVKNSYKIDCNSTNKEVTVGMALYKAELEELIENINIIEYYDNHGVQEITDKNWVSPSDYPIPHLRNSEVVDYEKLHELREKKMDEVFNYLRKHLDGMWD